MSPRGIVFWILFVVVLAVVYLVDRVIRPSLRNLLEEITALPAATEFYLRSFEIVVLFVGLAVAVGANHSELKAESRFMEYVWTVGADLQSILQGIFGVLLGYVALITILIAALRRRQP
jgi:hypothetical protein